jgi:hypothetical protein
MTESRYPPGWDSSRVQRLIDHYQGTPDEELATDDDAAAEDCSRHTDVTVPNELLPAIRQLLAQHKSIKPLSRPTNSEKSEDSGTG